MHSTRAKEAITVMYIRRLSAMDLYRSESAGERATDLGRFLLCDSVEISGSSLYEWLWGLATGLLETAVDEAPMCTGFL